jgi:hypothetical protein
MRACPSIQVWKYCQFRGFSKNQKQLARDSGLNFTWIQQILLKLSLTGWDLGTNLLVHDICFLHVFRKERS